MESDQKTALSIPVLMGAYDLKYAVMADDAKAISKVPGIGPKTAGKLIRIKRMAWSDDHLPEILEMTVMILVL